MKSKKNPRLSVLPVRDVVRPSWEEKNILPVINERAIKKQMDKLHNISGAVFLVTILLEICLWQFVTVMNTTLSFAGVVEMVAVSLAVGLLGGVLFYLTASVEASVRQNLSESGTEVDDYV